MTRPAFTLIETMLAVLLMALLASAVALNTSGPLRAARGQDAIDLVAAFDADARQAAIASGAPVRIAIDLADGSFSRFEESDATTPRAKTHLPSGFRIDQVRVGRQSYSIGSVPIELTAHGWGRSYAVRLVGPNLDRWISFAGLTGARTEVPDERSLPTPPPGYDAD